MVLRRLAQDADMAEYTLVQCVQIIAPLKYGNDPAVAVLIGHFTQFPGYPFIVVGLEIDLRERILAVCIKSCGDQDEIGPNNLPGLKEREGGPVGQGESP